MRRHGLALQIALKAGFKPDQPRVPRGNPGGGQWTAEGGSASGKVGDADTSKKPKLPTTGTTSSVPEVPKQRPPLSADRTAILKRIARRLGPLATVAEALYGAASWIHEYHAKIDSYRDRPKSMQELQDAVSDTSKAGYQDHHIVERTSAERDGKFPKSMIEGRDNVVRIPTMRHEDVNAWYQKRSVEFGNMSPRQYLRDKSWEERRRVGIQALIENGSSSHETGRSQIHVGGLFGAALHRSVPGAI